MSDADRKLTAVERLLETVETRFQLELELDAENRDHDSKIAEQEAAHQARVLDIQRRINPTDADIQRFIEEDRDVLIAPNKQSFVTSNAIFQFTKQSPYHKVRENCEAAIMEIARGLGIVRLLADPPTFKWKFSTKKFKALLKQKPELASHFEAQLELAGGGESLTIKPNAGYTVLHDSKRISPLPITIKKS